MSEWQQGQLWETNYRQVMQVVSVRDDGMAFIRMIHPIVGRAHSQKPIPSDWLLIEDWRLEQWEDKPHYIHSANCPNYCDYACNGKLGFEMAEAVHLATAPHPARSQSPVLSSEQCPACATPSGTPDTSPSVPPKPSDTPPSVRQ